MFNFWIKNIYSDKVGVGGFTLKLSFKGAQIRVHSWHAHLLPHFCILNGRKTNFVETKENAEKSENKKEVKKLLLYSYKYLLKFVRI